ncbi:MAG: cbb3-type cytochrome oxidase assembly protein CcoS [Bacteroidetes bacterium]|nr:cbb3-type cytochrome oxidase assembly protein CcoS [Bacteroidota bacterium]
MQVMFVLIGFSLLVALTFLGIFIWAVRSGQFEDQYTPSVRAVFDDEWRAENDEEKPPARADSDSGHAADTVEHAQDEPHGRGNKNLADREDDTGTGSEKQEASTQERAKAIRRGNIETGSATDGGGNPDHA